MTTSTTDRRPVTRTRVHDLAREIRREAKEIDQTVESMHWVATMRLGMPSLQDFVADPQAEYAQERLREMLNVIEGNAALLREMLGAD